MINTKRLLIAKATTRDLPALDRLLSDPQLCAAARLTLPIQPAALRRFSLQLLVENVRLFKISEWRRPDSIIGLIMLDHYYNDRQEAIPGEYELGYLLERPMWGKGIMTEAVHAFTGQFTTTSTLVAVTDQKNVASQRVLAKNNFCRSRINDGQVIWKYKKHLHK